MLMKITYRRPVSLLDAADGRRVRLTGFAPGAALVPLGEAQRILGFWPHGDHLTAYVAGTMPPAMRSAVEEGRTDEEEWFDDVQALAGIAEIDLTDARYAYLVRLPQAGRVVPMYPTTTEQAQQAA